MKQIKFSHRYKKMPRVLEGTYISEVTKVHFRDLTKEFVLADTETVDGQFYPLSQGWLLKIDLWTNGFKWQTLRPWNSEKEKYYRSLRGQEVQILIEEV